MKNENQAKEESILIGELLLLGGALSLLISASGCAGLELGGRAGLYRVDEKGDYSRTVQAQTKPLKCWFTDCGKGGE